MALILPVYVNETKLGTVEIRRIQRQPNLEVADYEVTLWPPLVGVEEVKAKTVVRGFERNRGWTALAIEALKAIEPSVVGDEPQPQGAGLPSSDLGKTGDAPADSTGQGTSGLSPTEEP